ncbi:hypothetical protein VP01_1476g2 [Puccinia sorghi]|uniref:Uncharacterized protein n=1 Tax=Puccinia sorghi TaxID=27349 RepID=A0A0L6VJS0_9BASI|nr:hypothetical protein VP01_1476g2 [Puccinia sorghi]
MSIDLHMNSKMHSEIHQIKKHDLWHFGSAANGPLASTSLTLFPCTCNFLKGSDYPQVPFSHGYLFLPQIKMMIPHPLFPYSQTDFPFPERLPIARQISQVKAQGEGDKFKGGSYPQNPSFGGALAPAYVPGPPKYGRACVKLAAASARFLELSPCMSINFFAVFCCSHQIKTFLKDEKGKEELIQRVAVSKTNSQETGEENASTPDAYLRSVREDDVVGNEVGLTIMVCDYHLSSEFNSFAIIWVHTIQSTRWNLMWALTSRQRDLRSPHSLDHPYTANYGDLPASLVISLFFKDDICCVKCSLILTSHSYTHLFCSFFFLFTIWVAGKYHCPYQNNKIKSAGNEKKKTRKKETGCQEEKMMAVCDLEVGRKQDMITICESTNPTNDVKRI